MDKTSIDILLESLSDEQWAKIKLRADANRAHKAVETFKSNKNSAISFSEWILEHKVAIGVDNNGSSCWLDPYEEENTYTSLELYNIYKSGMCELGEKLYSIHLKNVNKFNNDSHSRSFKHIADINQVIIEVHEQFAIPGVGMHGESPKEQIDSTLSNNKKRIAVVKQVLSSGFTRDGNPQHFYVLLFPFSETPDKEVLMTNQGWVPIDIEGRKTIKPEVLSEKNDDIFGWSVCYKEVDFYKQFSKEDILKNL